MPIVGFVKQGTGKLKTPHGPKVVGIINIRTSEREAAPQDNLFWYDLSHEHLLIKSLRRLHPVKLEPPTEKMVQAENKPDPAKFGEPGQPAAQNTDPDKPINDVIPAEEGTRPDNADPGICIGDPMIPQGDETQLDVMPAQDGIQE